MEARKRIVRAQDGCVMEYPEHYRAIIHLGERMLSQMERDKVDRGDMMVVISCILTELTYSWHILGLNNERESEAGR